MSRLWCFNGKGIMNQAKANFDPKRHSVYVPINMAKFDGKEYPVVRSSWEREFMQYLDINPSIIKWDSEAVAIQYMDPVKRKQRRYYPDFIMQVKDKDGKEKIFLVEIKPHKEVVPPRASKKMSEQSKIYVSNTYMTNMAKFHAADDFCKKKGWVFRILTEKELFKG